MKQLAYMLWAYLWGAVLGYALALTVQRLQATIQPAPAPPGWYPPPGAVEDLHREARRIIQGEWMPESSGVDDAAG